MGCGRGLRCELGFWPVPSSTISTALQCEREREVRYKLTC